MSLPHSSSSVRAGTRALAFFALAGVTMGAGGDENGGQGCAALSESEVPDFEGTWHVAYDDTMLVEITIGGAVYTAEVGPQGGAIDIDHNGQPLSFDLACEKPEVVCPSEAWPETVRAEQRNEMYQHQVIMTLPLQACDGDLVAPDAAECGEGTDNPDCEDVCTGEVVTNLQETFGVLDEDSETFELFLGGGVATNGINCALLGLSVAKADVISTDPDARGGWQAEAMENGEVITGYSGSCLWAGDPDMDGELEALVLGAGVKITTGFEATRQ